MNRWALIGIIIMVTVWSTILGLVKIYHLLCLEYHAMSGHGDFLVIELLGTP